MTLPKILQVDSLPEVRAFLAQRPVLRHSGWFLGLPVGRGVLEINQCFWQAWTFLNRPRAYAQLWYGHQISTLLQVVVFLICLLALRLCIGPASENF